MGNHGRERIIGREHPVGVLRAEIDRAADSHGGLVLVTGEAGIGKTTLVTSAAEGARRRGALVLSGSCWDSEVAPGYWPWVQVVRGLRRGVTPEEWAAAQATAGTGLAVLLGETPSGPAPGVAHGSASEQGDDLGDQPAETFRLYDAVTTALVSSSQRRPVIVVLDDLHWADTASLRLLEFAAQHTWFERLLLIGTYRDVEVESAGHPLSAVLAARLLGRRHVHQMPGARRPARRCASSSPTSKNRPQRPTLLNSYSAPTDDEDEDVEERKTADDVESVPGIDHIAAAATKLHIDRAVTAGGHMPSQSRLWTRHPNEPVRHPMSGCATS